MFSCSYGTQTMAMLLRLARTVSRNFNLIILTFTSFISPLQLGTLVTTSLPHNSVSSRERPVLLFETISILCAFAGVGTTDSALGDDGVLDIDTTISLETTWHDMEKLVSMGLVRSIGIRYKLSIQGRKASKYLIFFIIKYYL